MIKEKKELDSMGKEIDKELNEVKKNQLKTQKKDKKSKQKESKKDKKDKTAFITTTFKGELKKIHWPSRKEMLKYSIATIVFTIFMSGFCFGITAIQAELINLLGA